MQDTQRQWILNPFNQTNKMRDERICEGVRTLAPLSSAYEREYDNKS